jgi:PAS domain S-box-containing protein
MSNLLSTSQERVYFKDLMSRFLFVSEGWIEAVAPGRTAEELIGKTDFEVFTEEHASAAFTDEQQIIRTGEPLVGQVERETYSGRPDVWVSTTKMPLRDESGRIIGTFGISRDVTAQIRAEAGLARQAGELGAQNERLRELDRLKDEFVALVSHELRTPLTSIIGYIQLLRDERASGLDTDHFAEVIERNADRLLRLVGDLLFLSQMQSGRLALELRDTDLADLAAEAVEEARPEAAGKHVDLTLSVTPVPRVTVDPTRIAQLLGNLVSNAVKFTPEGGKVEVALAVDGGEAVLSVADTGIGIQAADRERVFERFFRTEAATQRVIPGSGLGLTISRAIVDAHQGTITVRSDGEHGSTFTVRLPLAPEPRALARQAFAPEPQALRSCLASGQPGPDPGHVGLVRLLARDGRDGLADRRGRLRLALLGQRFGDLADLGVGQLSSADTTAPGSVPAWTASAPSADQRPDRPAHSV